MLYIMFWMSLKYSSSQFYKYQFSVYYVQDIDICHERIKNENNTILVSYEDKVWKTYLQKLQ